MVVTTVKSLLIVVLLALFTKFSHVKAFDLPDLDDLLADLIGLLPDFEWPPMLSAPYSPPLPNLKPHITFPPPSPPPPSPSPPPPLPPPPPPSKGSFFIPPFLGGPIDPTPKIIPPLIIPGIPSITNPTPSSPVINKSPPPPSQCKPSPPDHSAKQPPLKAPSPATPPAKEPPPRRAPSPSPVRQPTPPPAKAPPSKKSPPPAPPPSKANPLVMAPSPSPAVITAPFPSSPVAKPPLNPRRPVKPIQAPSLPPPKILTVNGVVYCKPCKSYGVPTLLNASPLQGASVRLVCYNGKDAIVQSAITDNNGEFQITPKSLIGADIGKCKVYLVKSPNPTCNVATNFNAGKTGSLLQHIVPPKPPIVTPTVVAPVQPPMSDLYGAGPFIFEASTKMPCAMHKKLKEH